MRRPRTRASDMIILTDDAERRIAGARPGSAYEESGVDQYAWRYNKPLPGPLAPGRGRVARYHSDVDRNRGSYRRHSAVRNILRSRWHAQRPSFISWRRQEAARDGLHRCTLHVACCALRVARARLHVARCTLHAARCALHAARCTLHAARCTLALHAARCMSRCTLHAARCTLHRAPRSTLRGEHNGLVQTTAPGPQFVIVTTEMW